MKKKHFRENRLYFGGFGEMLHSFYFKDFGSIGKMFQGTEEFSFRDMGRSTHYFEGSREHRPPGASILIV